MLSSLLTSALSTIIVDIIGIIAIILIGAFVVALVSDLLLLIFDRHSNGIFFHRNKESKDDKRYNKNSHKDSEAVKQKSSDKKQSSHKNDNVSITPLFSLDDAPVKENNNFTSNNADTYSYEDDFKAVDFDMAVQEQKLLQEKMGSSANSKLFIAEGANDNNVDNEEEIDIEDDEDDISDIISAVQKQAIKELEEEDALKGKEKVSLINDDHSFIVEDDTDQVVDKKATLKSSSIPTRRVAGAKIIYKKVEDNQDEVKVNTTKEVVDKDKEQEESFIISEIKKIREEIYDLRRNVFNEIYSSRNGAVTKSRKNEIEDLELQIIDKLNNINAISEKSEVVKEEEKVVKKEQVVESENKDNKLEQLRKESEALKDLNEDLEDETERLKEEKLHLSQESETLKEEKEKLAAELQSLKNSAGIEIRPLYSKAYYEQRLTDLTAELKDAKKELRLNNREFNPLKRLKKSFDRDSIKLRRKEAIVAKHKVKIYGVNNSDNIDPEKVEKLEEEVDQLRKLKDSVYHCDTVLRQNKDRYPVLEKANRIIRKHIASITRDIEQVNKSLKWFEENTDDASGDTTK